MQNCSPFEHVQPARKGYLRSLSVVVVVLLLGASVGGYLLLNGKNSEQEQRLPRYGGLEIGSKGIKAIVVEAFSDPTFGIDVRELGKLEPVNPDLVKNLAQTKQFDVQALKETAAALKRFQEQMLKEHDIPPENIYVAASSGLFAPLKGDEQEIKKNQDILSAVVQEAIGKRIEFMSVKREVDLSIRGCVPRKHIVESLYFDVGSGNTKGGFRIGAELVYLELPYGTKSFYDLVQKTAKETGVPFDKQASLLREQELQPALEKHPKPDLTDSKRNRLYLSGGIVWALATLVHPENQSPFVELSAKDIDTFQDMLLREQKDPPNPDLSEIKDEKTRQKAQEEVRNVRKVFKLEELKAGTEILKALSNKLDFPKKKIWFARRGYLGWITAYVIEKEDKAR